ncbi:MAG: hypothetical protein HY538_00375 [Deltaproteobacteria bacterium]|nr:hypothetical protein [Deltaproteobacteria bacterium]
MKKLLFLGFIVFLANCGSDSSNPDVTPTTTTQGLRFDSAGDFSSSASVPPSIQQIASALTTGQCSDLEAPITQDDPILEDGLDCDEDDGLVAHITPSHYSLALKRISLVPEDESGASIDFIADTGTLAQSEVIEFTTDDSSETIITLDPEDLTAGTYSGVEMEIYYFELTFLVAGVEQKVRIYMSDDDFEAEGNLGHHQGDITFMDDDGTELGWIDDTWTTAGLSTTRGKAQNGAGGTDAETDHDRGFFGDANLWDLEVLNQGVGQDIYLTTLEFDSPLEIPDISSFTNLITITATFSVADTFFYEDFEPQDTSDFPGFFPADGGEASSEGAAWAPLTPTAELSVEVSTP